MASRDELHPTFLGLFLLGGLCTGFGILNIYWAFGWNNGTNDRVPFNQDLAHVGFTALDNLSRMPKAESALLLLVAGVCCLVVANATAWKETNGY